MRLLLDENLPVLLKHQISGHDIATVQELGWTSIKNGRLLTLAEEDFDVLITADRGMQYQQNMTDRNIALIVLQVPNTKVATFRVLIPSLLRAVENIKPGEVINITS